MDIEKNLRIIEGMMADDDGSARLYKLLKIDGMDDEDDRPPAKPRKHPRLWQAYLWWREEVKSVNAHVERMRSALRGKSEYDPLFEVDIILKHAVKVDGKWRLIRDLAMDEMIEEGRKVGPIWDWLNCIRGIAEASAAKVLAQFDDSGKYPTISQARRYAGWGGYFYWIDKTGAVMAPRDGWKSLECKDGLDPLCRLCHEEMRRQKTGYVCGLCGWRIKDGDKVNIYSVQQPKPEWTLATMPDRRVKDWVCPYNRILKAEIWVIVDSFIKQRTPIYREHYDEAKAAERRKHPKRQVINGRTLYSDMHIHRRAMRKVAQLFISHLWVKWREFDGLPVTQPYEANLPGHGPMIPPPEFELEMA